MSTTIQDALDLPVLEDLLKNPDNKVDAEDDPEITDEMVEEHESDAQVAALSTALASGAVTTEVVEARQAQNHEKQTQEVYKEAMQHSKDLMDLGYNVDTRSAGRIFENAANMLKIALDAANATRSAQQKHSQIQIEKRKIELAEREFTGPTDADIEGEAVVVEDRNELIKRLREQAKNDNK